MIQSTTEVCGLPASTVKLSLPALTTCDGVRYLEQSIYRCREDACLCSLTCVTLCVRVCFTLSVTVRVCVCVCVKR